MVEDGLKPSKLRDPYPVETHIQSIRPIFLPTMTYGVETWTVMKKVHRLKVAQRAMERAMLGLSLLDRIPNVEIRN
ncbi:jg264 [Pararge aegeria aegeria]|uniref:Jg264 protein n=1 Tax=Pararge aegeria aegeria TaxID=348720 RepID=A0A8S4QNH5_9NEOP|nr:jg264 [Pararge aegeria aegeria]